MSWTVFPSLSLYINSTNFERRDRGRLEDWTDHLQSPESFCSDSKSDRSPPPVMFTVRSVHHTPSRSCNPTHSPGPKPRLKPTRIGSQREKSERYYIKDQARQTFDIPRPLYEGFSLFPLRVQSNYSLPISVTYVTGLTLKLTLVYVPNDLGTLVEVL